MLKKSKFYSLDKIKSKNATYNIIFGLRSNGKTYAVLKEGLLNYVKNNKQMALVRRWKEDFTGKRGNVMFDSLISNDEVKKATKGKFTLIIYKASKWYLAYKDEDGNTITDERPFCYAFALSEMEHDKSTSYPDITLVLFDEFISRFGYLRDEFVLFLNVISTIVRGRTDVVIYMCGNTVNKYCPYFGEMGLKHIKDMKVGDIDIYSYGDSCLTVAVEYCGEVKATKKNDYYFAFDNPKLKMITSGAWEIDIYPHLPFKYKPKDIVFSYFIEFNGEIVHCEIIQTEHTVFTYIHKKTTPIKDDTKDIIYTTSTHAGRNYRRNITKPIDLLDKRIYKFFTDNKVFYQTNEIGEIIRNYLLWCSSKG